MNPESPQCSRENCSRKAIYYCHSQKQPSCAQCSRKPCKICKEQPRNSINDLNWKQRQERKKQFCHCCNEQIRNEGVSYSCTHHLSIQCAFKIIRTAKKWLSKFQQQSILTIQCLCSAHSSQNISNIVNKYCLCCGDSLGDRVIALKYGFRLKNTCRNKMKIRRSNTNNNEQNILTKQDLQKLSLKCGDANCNKVIEEDTPYCKQCRDKHLQSEILVEETVQTVKQQQNNKKQEYINNAQLNSAQERAPNINKAAFSKKPAFSCQESKRQEEINDDISCGVCLKSAKKASCQQNFGAYICSSCIKSNSESKQSKEEKKIKCSHCQKYFFTNFLDRQSSSAFCHECVSKDKQIWNQKQKGLAEQSLNHRSKNDSMGSQSMKKQGTTEKMKEHATDRTMNVGRNNQYFKIQKIQRNNSCYWLYRCIICNAEDNFSVTKTISSQLGGHLCSKCLKQQNNIAFNTPTSFKKVKKEADSINQQIKSFKQFINSQQDFEIAGKHIELEGQIRNQSVQVVERPLLASFITQYPDNVDLMLNMKKQISCFRCHYFIAERDMINHHDAKICLSCFTWLIFRSN